MKRAIGIVLVATSLGAGLAADWRQQLEARMDALLEAYRHLHAHPELSYQERETAAYLSERLRRLGFEVSEQVGDYAVEGRESYGLVAVMRNGEGPTVMVRTDLDALPVEEKTGKAYASRATGISDTGESVPVMHACGHDLHMASFLGAATILSQNRDRWQGTLVMIGQPAEERGAGARAMLADGLYQRFPRPDYAIALHADASMEAGLVGLVSGYALANVDSVDIRVAGRGGHGAYPHTTHDPVVLAAQIVTNLQAVVSRRVSPLDSAVITVGSIHGGTKHNVIPDEVRLQLTVRSYRPAVRRLLLEGIREVAENTARAAGFPDELLPEVRIQEDEFTPSTYNDPALVERLASAFRAALGEDRVVAKEPVMGGEDFSRYSLEGEIPIAMFWLGAVEPAKVVSHREREIPLPSLHSSEFAPEPEPAIRTGVTALVAGVLELMEETP